MSAVNKHQDKCGMQNCLECIQKICVLQIHVHLFTSISVFLSMNQFLSGEILFLFVVYNKKSSDFILYLGTLNAHFLILQ